MGLSIQFYVWSLLCNVFLFSISKFELFSGTYITDFTVWFGLFKCKFDFRNENILSRKSILYNESTLQFKNSYKTNDRELASFSLLQKCTKNKLRLFKCVISSNWNRFRILNQQFVTENFFVVSDRHPACPVHDRRVRESPDLHCQDGSGLRHHDLPGLQRGWRIEQTLRFPNRSRR